MKEQGFILRYLLLLVAQIAISVWFHVTPFIMLTILPAMVLCIPIKVGTSPAIFIAFATGLAVDLLSEGVIGINVLALVPVAFARKTFIRFIFGEDLIARGDDFSVRRYGFWKVAFAVILVQSLFLIVYIIADGAGTRPLWFNIVRFILSLATGFALSLVVVDQLTPDDRKKR